MSAIVDFPIHSFRDSTRVVAVDHLLEARSDVCFAMLAKLDHNPAAVHLVGDCASSAGTSEGVQNEVCRIRAYRQNPLN